ncbi:MAG: response regulator transcription factor [Parvibaculum sp.]|nr:response regulator transcription factor [Parvibaculum sp.]
MTNKKAGVSFFHEHGYDIYMNILLADDHPLFTDAIERQLIAAYPNVKVLAVEDLPAAITILSDGTQTDLAVLDWDMPGMEGASSITDLRNRFPDLKLVILSGRINDATVHEVLGLGVKGFIPKSSTGNTIVAALSVIMSGGTYLPVETALSQGRNAWGNTTRPVGIQALTKALTDREVEILKLLAGGGSNKEIARQLGLQEITIKMHASRIFAKLHVRNRVQAVSHALKAGLLNEEHLSS